MKNKKGLIFSLVAIISTSSLMAQTSQDWKTTGNSLTAPGKLGTTTAQDVLFISNNIVNGALNKNGRWGFGTGADLPAARLHLKSIPGEDALRVQVANSTKLLVSKTGGVSIGTLSDGPVNGLTVSGNTGIGISTPASKLHVRTGSSGTTPFSLSVVTAESATNTYMNLLSPNANESGILFGTAANNISGGIIYNSVFTGTSPNGLQFRTNGNVPRMVLNKDGFLNVGPGLNEDYRVRLDHSSTLGFDIANSSSNTDWELFAGTNGLNLFVDGGAGGPKGIFNRSTGVYSSLSDERSKSNIKPMADVLADIKRLKAASYQFKNSKDKQVHDGFIAQEVMHVFPALVTHNVDAERKVDEYLLDYSGFGVIAIKGIQELIKKNDSLSRKISEADELKKRVEQLESLLNASPAPIGPRLKTVELTNASLEQNTPNPLQGSTIINYTLPAKFSKAQMLITDVAAKPIKQIDIKGQGKGSITVDASSLVPGVYHYALIVDGRVISSKQMMVAR